MSKAPEKRMVVVWEVLIMVQLLRACQRSCAGLIALPARPIGVQVSLFQDLCPSM